ncbi:MAG: secretin N-terminal domain-containing protein, partial [Candidatus Omnitrophota bacterium]
MRRFLACFIILFFLFSGAAPAVPADDPDLISLDLKGMDIRDVLKILAQKSGLNIVADSDVKGVVTLYLKDVSPMDALNIVVTINNLGYVESGALIRVMSDRTYERLHGKKFGNITRTEVVQLKYANSSDVARVLEGIRTEIGKVIPEDVSKTIVLIDVPDNIKKMKELVLGMDVPFVTEVFDLDYAKADALKEKIGGILSKDLGSVSFDERTNKLIVKDTAAKMAEVKQLVSEFDEKTRDVVIDASIVQVALADKDSFGIDWSQIAKMGDVVINAEASLNTGLAAPGPNKLSIATTGGNYSSVFNFLSAYGKTEILSRPRITVMDGHEAKILVGSKEVYVSSDVTTTTGGTYH